MLAIRGRITGSVALLVLTWEATRRRVIGTVASLNLAWEATRRRVTGWGDWERGSTGAGLGGHQRESGWDRGSASVGLGGHQREGDLLDQH